ncbi:MAG TPA: spore coat U domain-containing protein [Halomonas sp.]|nr:spore coat U domain-containing protein [Halomonas sp.]
MRMKPLLLTATLAVTGLIFAPANAATVTSTMDVTITLENACEISTAPTELAFGTHGVLSANVDSTSTIGVTCTTDAAYDIGLDGGGSGDINARVMTLTTNEVGYQLYQESDRTTIWGDTVGTDTVASTGTGSEESFTVYGRVPSQVTPPAGAYTDTVTVTVTY